MICGLAAGSLIKTFADDFVFIQKYLANRLFHVTGNIFVNVLKILVAPLLRNGN